MNTRTNLLLAAVFCSLLFAWSNAIGQVTTFPYLEDFDTGTSQLTQSTADNMDWALNSGSTLSPSTGPSGDHTTGSGNYMYVEATGHTSDQAIMESPFIDLSTAGGAPEIDFWYHMYGQTMGTLLLFIYDGSSWTQVWSDWGDQGDQWNNATVDLSTFAGQTIQYRFTGVVGANFWSDIAIDDIAINAGQIGCTPSFTNTCTTGDYIDDVTFNTISNLNTACAAPGTNNYSNYTGMSTNIVLSTGYVLTVQVGGFSEHIGCWVDWNQDGDFQDANEFTYLGQISANGTGATVINVPATATTGATTMRVMAKWGGSALTQGDLCNSFTYGEVEDYTVIVNSSSVADMQALDAPAPTSNCVLSATETIEIQVSNQGTGSISNVPVYYQINGGTVVSDVISTTLSIGQTYTHQFSTTANLSADGIYNISLWTAATGDIDNTNDTVTVQVENEVNVSAYPFTESFDAFPVDNATFAPYLEPNTQAFPSPWMQQLGDGADWYGRSVATGSTGTGPTTDHTSGTGIYVFVEDGSNNNDSVGLILPCVNLGAMSQPHLSYWVHSQMATGAAGPNYMVVDVWYGNQWNVVDSVGNLGTSVWVQRDIDLSGYPGWVDIRWRVNNSNSDFYHDIAIDDVNLYNASYFTQEPSDQTICFNNSTSFDAVVDTAYTATAYQWQLNTGGGWGNLANGTFYSGATTNQLDILNAPLSFDGYEYRCVVTILGSSYSSLSGTLTVTNNSTTVSLGSDLSLCPGSSATLDPGSGYSSFVWNEGTTTQTLAVDTFCYLYLSMFDTYGDGWNGGSLNLIIDGVVHGPLSAAVFQTDTVFQVYDGQVVSINYTSGQWENENTYTLTNDQGQLLFSDGINPSTGFVYNSIVDCSTIGYSVVVTDANGCTATDTVLVDYNATGFVDLGPDTNICAGATLTLDAGTADTYSWSTLETTQTISVASAGTYMVTVSTGGACVGSDTIVVGINTAPAVQLGNDTSICSGDSLLLQAGTGFSSYQWSPNGSGSTLYGMAPGTYSVTVTDGNGCTGSDAIVISANTPPTIDLGPDTNICPGGSAVLDAGSGFGYSWSSGSSSQNITVTNAGTYTVTITDGSNCTASDAIAIGINTPPSPNLGSNVVLCDGDSTVLDPGAGFAAYLWSDNSNQTTLTATTAGSYSVTVTDNNSCTGSDSVTLTAVASLAPFGFTTSDATCGSSDGSATASTTVGSAPYTYAWSTGTTSATASGLAAGSYTVTITDANGCSASDIVAVGNSNAPTLSTNSSDANCFGEATGTAAVSGTGGVLPYSYLWSNGATTNSATGLAAGTYVVSVTDAQGCVATETVSIGEPTALMADILSLDANCGQSDGQVIAQPSGGTSPYSYLWSTGHISLGIMGLDPGPFSLTITDAHGCVDSASAYVSNIGAPSLTVNGSDVNCPGGNNGSASAVPSGGATPYTYNWSNGQTSALAIALQEGSYTVTVSDANGCDVISDVTISAANAAPTVDLGPDQEICADQSAVLDAGTGFQSYTWSNFTNGQTLSTSTSGVYSVIVTDGNGCSGSDTAEVVVNALPTVNLGNDFSLCAGTTASLDAGSGSLSYSWTSGDSTQTITVSNPGTYGVTVSDGNSCSATDAITISSPDSLVFITTTVDASCGNADGSAVVSVTNGDAPYTYDWSNGSSSSINANIAAGIYSVTVSDANGCSLEQSVTIANTGAPTLSTISNDVNCFGGTNGTALVTATGGNAPYTYAWSNGASTAAATNLAAGTYAIDVTDASGCVASSLVTISQPAEIVLATSTTVANCGAADGSATVVASGGSAPFNYLWSDDFAQTVSTAISLEAGTYTVTVTDGAGCTNTATAAVTNQNGPGITLNVNNVTCSGGSDGSASAAISGGTLPYTYLWDDPQGQTSANASNLAEGIYFLSVTDAAGCVAIESATIGADNQSPTVALGPDTLFCGGETVTLDAGAGFVGYQWSTTETTQTIAIAEPGTYSVEVSDINGCTANDTLVADTVYCPGIVELGASGQLSVFPNPNAGNFTLEFREWAPQSIRLEILNSVGQLIYAERVAVGSLQHRENLQLNLPAGVYFVRAAAATRVHQTRVVVQ